MASTRTHAAGGEPPGGEPREPREPSRAADAARGAYALGGEGGSTERTLRALRRTQRRSLAPAALLGGAAVLAAVGAAALASWAVVERGGAAPAAAPAEAAASEALALLAEPATARIPLPVPTGTVVLAAGADGRAFLVASGLPPASDGRTYRVWVYGPAGSVEPAASFDGLERAVRLDVPVRPGAEVALTLEPAGGSFGPPAAPLARVRVPGP
jgi:hypothetical protein